MPIIFRLYLSVAQRGSEESWWIVTADEGEESNVVGTEADEEEARLEAILEQYGGGLDFGFKRRERLDVKKPGPPFLTNSYAYRVSTHIFIQKYIFISLYLLDLR
jgi:hypothetical protein